MNFTYAMWESCIQNGVDSKLNKIDYMSIIYNKPARCNSGNIVFINNCRYALHVSDALCVHYQEHYKL